MEAACLFKETDCRSLVSWSLILRLCHFIHITLRLSFSLNQPKPLGTRIFSEDLPSSFPSRSSLLLLVRSLLLLEHSIPISCPNLHFLLLFPLRPRPISTAAMAYSSTYKPRPFTDVFTGDTDINRRKTGRTVPMKVLILGLGRTGTAC